jgi:hypothetical protein
MAAKKKGNRQRNIIRHTRHQDDVVKKDKSKSAEESVPEKVKMPERVREKDSGFGVLKVVGAVIAVLIVGSMVLYNRAGGRETMRGDKMHGEQCQETQECKSGTICYSYKGARKRCMTTCRKDKKCDPGYNCVTAAKQKGRKGYRLTDICVEDGAL